MGTAQYRKNGPGSSAAFEAPARAARRAGARPSVSRDARPDVCLKGPMHDPAPTPAPRRRRLVRAAWIAGGVLAAYVAFGFLAAPPILKHVLVTQAGRALRRPVAVARVRVNPLALSVTIDGLAVAHPDGAPFLGWDSLYVRLAPWRLLAGDVGVGEIRLVRPVVHVALGPDGTPSFEDLLPQDGGARPAAPATPEREGGGLGLWIGRLAIEGATVTFRDATRTPAFETALGPLTVRLESFRTKGGRGSPYAFEGTTDAGETFRWTGTVGTRPIRSEGTLAFERIALPRYEPYVHDEYPIDLLGGRLDLETRYALEWSAARHVLRLSGGRIAVSELAVAPRGVRDAPVKLPRIEVTGVDVDALARDARVAAVAVRGGAVRVRRERDGGLELSRMMPPPSPSRWTWSVGAVDVSGLAVALEDLSTPRPVALPLTDVALHLEGLRRGSAPPSPLSLALAWNGTGRLAVKGTVEPFGDRGALDVDAEGLDLAPLAPYLDREVSARLTGGRAGARAKVSYDASGKATRWTFAGDVRLDGLAVAERGNDALLRWRALEIDGVDASSARRASVKLVRLVEPQVRAYVWEDGTTSVGRALRPAAPAAAAAAAAPAAAARQAAAPAWQLAIGAVRVERGRAALVDRSVTPSALLDVSRVDARVAHLSTDPRVRSDVDVRLQVEGASPIEVTGTLNPLQKDLYTDLAVASKGVDLTPFGPYSGKYLGYGLDKGKLDLDLHYRIEQRALASTNVVRVNQLTLGQKTDSPDATHIPVRLALALLQDPQGVILLDVPVEGKLDDPEFHLGKVIWRTVLNVLVKVATSPFKALAALAGGGDADLSQIEFVPGTADPAPGAQDRLAMLAKSLAQRPALGLEVEGAADPAADGPALRRAALDAALRRDKAASMRPPPTSPDAVVLSTDDRARLVRAAWDATVAGPARKRGEAIAKSPTAQEMEAALEAAQEVAPDAYRALAAERARRAREALLAAGIDPARLFLAQGGDRAEKEKGARAYFTVK